MTTILPLTLAAYPELLALWQACPGIGLSAADDKENIARFLARNPGLSFLVSADGRVAGSLLAGHDGRRGYLYHLTVHPQYRRQGLGRMLVAACLAALAQEGIQKCHLFLFDDNELARRFWQAVGWQLRGDILVASRLTD